MKDFLKFVFASITGYIILMVLFSFLGVAFIASMALGGDKPQPVKEHSVLKLELAGEIIDRQKDDIFSELPFFDDDRFAVLGLNEILETIDKAKKDPNIDGIYLGFGGLSAGFATCEEIREALVKFKDSGKFIYSYAGYYSQLAYYIATASDSIFLNPGGGLDLRGFASEQMFFKNALEKLDVEVNIIKHGKFKSAVEPFFKEENSPENVEQISAIINGFWSQFAATVGEARGIVRADLDRYADSVMMFQPQELNVTYKLVDDLKYYSDVEAIIRSRQGIKEDEKLKFVALSKYKKAASAEKKNSSDNEVAIVYATGAIDGGSDGIQSGKLTETLRKIHKDDKIKALVIRVNSPGGSAYGSEQIWYEVKRLAAKMPVVVSMGDVAASGGYYIACAADTIVASPTTITGSIGAFGVMMKLGKTLNKVGITFDGIKTHEYSDIVSETRSMLPAEKNMMQKWLDQTYDDFVNRCAEGRNTTYQAIDEVAQGRVWTGADAKEQGLIDIFGGVQTAVETAAAMAKLEDYKTVSLPKQKNFMERLMEDFQMEMETRVMKIRLGDDYAMYEKVKELESAKGIQMRVPFDLQVY